MDVKEVKSYICHYCATYITPSRKDIKNHFERKNKCQCMTLFSYDEAKILSLSKQFVFDKGIKKLLTNDLIYIINNYNESVNYISQNYKKKSNENKKKEEILDKNEKMKGYEILNTSCLPGVISEISEEYNNEEKIESIISVLNEEVKSKKNIDKIIFDESYFNKDKNKYICPDCNMEYKSKYNLIKHMNNIKACQYQQTVNKLLKKSDQLAIIKKEKEAKEQAEYTQHLVQNINTQNIGTQNNINNINNNNNNTKNYNITLRDFVHDNYDLTHIKDTFYEKKDFFIYPNLLRMIMENENNRNVIFSNGEAIVYSDNELNRMSSDKAGYLILDKLSYSVDQLLYRQSDEVREFYKYINKYYYVIKGHYKHDTIYKDYNVDDKRFEYTASSNMFRSRDKYLSKMITCINQHSDEIRSRLGIDGYQIKDIPLVNPSIEDFVSAKMRYRDLKDKD